MAKLEFSSYRTGDIRANLERMSIKWLDVMVAGVTGAEKSATF